MIELSTGISNLKELKETDIESYDAVYLGNPFCIDYEDNFLKKTEDIQKGVEFLKSRNKKAYITTPAVPRNEDFKFIYKLLEASVKSGIDAVEVHNMGVLRTASKIVPDIPKHIGILANIYTSFTCEKLKEYGGERITTNPEVTLDEIGIIIDKSKIDVSFLVHGKIPLGITGTCFLLEEKAGICPEVCKQAFWLKSKEWVLKNVGKGVYSGKDLCMIEHLDLLLKMGLKYFRIESLYETPEYRCKLGNIYKSAFLNKDSGRKNIQQILKISEYGICNGYYFSKSGRYYIDGENKLHENRIFGGLNG